MKMKKILNAIRDYKFLIWFCIFVIGLITAMFIHDIAGLVILSIGAGTVLITAIINIIINLIGKK